MRISLCVGNYSTTPYMIMGLDVSVYCAEELCYYLKENVFLLDSSMMEDGLLRWLDRECGLTELAKMLHPIVHKQGSFSQFVGNILSYVGLYDEGIVAEVCRVLKRSAGLSGMEKRKEQVDYLVEKKKYPAAIRGYEALLNVWKDEGENHAEKPGNEVRAAILHNSGVAYAGMMMYDRAAEDFMEAYRITGNKEEYMCYLSAKRMGLGEKDYVAFATEQMEHYELTLELEKRLSEIRSDFESRLEYGMLNQLKQWRAENNRQSYAEETERCIRLLKQNYRSIVGE